MTLRQLELAVELLQSYQRVTLPTCRNVVEKHTEP